jgi:hypothetical protein
VQLLFHRSLCSTDLLFLYYDPSAEPFVLANS